MKMAMMKSLMVMVTALTPPIPMSTGPARHAEDTSPFPCEKGGRATATSTRHGDWSSTRAKTKPEQNTPGKAKLEQNMLGKGKAEQNQDEHAILSGSC